ncbi:hypothetical protein TEA_021294 [Camellia sinensis var. sinensis]|uniref:RNA helicase n=1 Tax=Camellia sinensis var. sinensis TaxID=542762 RepID=A0A4S4DXH8_CAMSN|nr:hypothetical protein TEA_021294 [Camellia sinensis var. sinensis]
MACVSTTHSTLFHGGSLLNLDHNTLTVLVHGSLTVEIGLSALYPIPISGLHELLLILHVLESKLMPQRGLRLSENSEDHIPDHILRRRVFFHFPFSGNLMGLVKDVGFVVPTDVQQKALPILLSGHDCIVHAQLLECCAKPAELGEEACCVMALLDGGMLRRLKKPPTILVATLGSLCQMIDMQILKLDSMQVLVIDEVDFMFNSSKQVSSFRKLLISYSLRNNRQTIFASASIPQHRRFLSDCIQQKWIKDDVVHVHVNAVEPMPSRLHHGFVSEKSKKAGHAPPTTLLIELLKTSLPRCFDILILEEDMNYNLRAASLFVSTIQLMDARCMYNSLFHL